MDAFLWTIDTTAERCQVDTPTLLRLVRDGDIPQPVIIGGLVRFNAFDLERWRSSGCPKSDPPAPRQMLAIRRAMIHEGDDQFFAACNRLSAQLDTADAATLARVEQLLSD